MSKFGRHRKATKDLQHIKWRDQTPPFAWFALVLLVLVLLLSLIWEIRSSSPHSRVPFDKPVASHA